MLPKFLLSLLSLAVTMAPLPQAAAATSSSPFHDRPEPVPGVHVDDARQWNGATAGVLKQPDDKDETIVTRRGSVLIAPGVTVDVVTKDNQINFPYFFQLVQPGAKAGPARVILDYAVMQLRGTEWYFPGNGFVYVTSQQWKLCGPSTTHKFRWTGLALEEVSQPVLWIGATANVQTTTPLYDAPDGQHVIATVLKGSQVEVIGMRPIASWNAEGPNALLVKTPLGLVGWHRFFGGTPESAGQLDIYMCN